VTGQKSSTKKVSQVLDPVNTE